MELSELCGELRNWFSDEIYLSTFTVIDGSVDFKDDTKSVSDILLDGQYFRIVGSVFNDGVYKYPVDDLKDEEFSGAIWAMRVPNEVLDLLDEINAWLEKYGESVNSPYQSESFGGYSYTKGTLSNEGTTKSIGWSTIFRAKLNRWRKI